MNVTTEKNVGVVVADSSEEFRLLLADGIARDEGLFLLAHTGDGEEAVELIRKHRPDVLVLDVLLTHRDGIAVLRRLREEGICPKTLVVSAFLNESVTAEVKDLGASYCVTKPCSLPELLERIRSCAEGHRSHTKPTYYEADIVEALSVFGIPHHLHGYRFLLEAIRRTIEDPSVIRGITKILYPDLGRHFHTLGSRVERAMRTAVEAGWEHGDPEQRANYFGPYLRRRDQRPSNSAFIAMCAEHIRVKYQNSTSRSG